MAKQPSSQQRVRKKAGKAVSKRAVTAKRPAKRPAQSERILHMHCQQWLEKSGWWGKLLIFHVPNERRGGLGTIMHFKRLGVRPGIADYLLFGLNRDAAIELKDRDGKQSEDQEKFQVAWEAVGKLYFIARDLESFQGIVTGLSLFCC